MAKRALQSDMALDGQVVHKIAMINGWTLSYRVNQWGTGLDICAWPTESVGADHIESMADNANEFGLALCLMRIVQRSASPCPRNK